MNIHVLLGGTGTLGKALTALLLRETEDRIRVIARNEYQMGLMKRAYPSDRMSYITADVRDEDRIRRVIKGANYVYHMAALKHVHTCEYDVLEASRTNVEGTANVVRACIDAGIEKAVLVSTDKAVEPTTSYGAMKMVAERTFIYGNHYRGKQSWPSFHCVRYGNVLASNGSVVQLWAQCETEGRAINIADPDITRFWWTPEDAASFVYQSMSRANSGDVFVPLMHSCSLGDIADMVAPKAERIRTNGYSTEKTHEVLLAPYEIAMASYVDGMDAVRVSYLRPPPRDERPWKGLQLSSQACVSVSAVAAQLGG